MLFVCEEIKQACDLLVCHMHWMSIYQSRSIWSQVPMNLVGAEDDGEQNAEKRAGR